MTALPTTDCTCTPNESCVGADCETCARHHGCPAAEVTDQARTLHRIIGQARLAGMVVTRTTEWVVRDADGYLVLRTDDEAFARSEKAYTPGGTIKSRPIVTFAGGES